LADSVRWTAAMSDILGERGERIFFIIMTRFFGGTGPLFRVTFLSDKARTMDFLVETVIGAGEITPYCLVQVKTTKQDISRRGGLQTPVSQRDMQRLRSYPGPTYVVGIHEPTMTGYIISARSGDTSGLRTFPTTFPLDQTNLEMLYEEVREYWTQQGATFNFSRFS